MNSPHALALFILAPNAHTSRRFTSWLASPTGPFDVTATFPAPPQIGGNVTFTAPGAFTVE